jgi:FSR family fosmidomycin resistance protein-like MFS transporter
MERSVAQPALDHAPAEKTAVAVLVALSLSHLLNDTLQALIPSIYPLIKDSFHLNFTEVALITLTYQLTASVLQPVIGMYTDRRPQPYSLPIGMSSTLIGLVLLSLAPNFHTVLFAAGLMGIGSAIFHPEASRLARLASGGKHGLAQSFFQVGGNLGTSLGPLLAALFIVGVNGQAHIGWFSVLALIGIVLLARLGTWYRAHLRDQAGKAARKVVAAVTLSAGEVRRALAVLLSLIFSKYIYLVSLTNFYTFYLIHKFGLSVQRAQIFLFIFLFAVAAGTFIGGPLGDRFGRKYIIWASILGAAPFTLALPYAGLTLTAILTTFIGVILASAFSAIVVYGQELMPGKVGMVAGLFFGFAFGVAGIGSVILGRLADHTDITFVFKVCSFLPLLGLLTIFLPNLESTAARKVRV